MSKEWYDIDVKREVLEKINEYIKSNGIEHSVTDALKERSVRDMMDISFLKTISGIDEIEAFADFVAEQYYYFRTLKYGQKEFWTSATNEREIGYNYKWYQFILKLLKKYCRRGDNVFFVGTADGSEIPDKSDFDFYALEQIENSVDNIDTSKVVKVFQGDFEDTEFVVENGHHMKAIVALRCLMPNTRLENFLQFAENNIVDEGVLILSHPMGYIDADGEFGALPESNKKLLKFDDRLKKAISKMSQYKIVEEIETFVEYFYILKVIR